MNNQSRIHILKTALTLIECNVIKTLKLAEGAGIEPAKAYSAHVGFEDREGHQTPSTSVFQ